MTLTLTVGKKDLEAKASFAFLKEVENLGNFNVGTNKYEGGIENLLTSLVSNEIASLVDFWNAALAHYSKKDRPTVLAIEGALEEHIEENGIEDAFKDAYKFMETSGFFAKKVTSFWEMFEMAKTLGKTDEEKEQNEMMYDRMMKLKAEIEA